MLSLLHERQKVKHEGVMEGEVFKETVSLDCFIMLLYCIIG